MVVAVVVRVLLLHPGSAWIACINHSSVIWTGLALSMVPWPYHSEPASIPMAPAHAHNTLRIPLPALAALHRWLWASSPAARSCCC